MFSKAKNSVLLGLAALGSVAGAVQSAPAPAPPPAEDGAAAALKASTRHGEWVDIAVEGSTTKVRTFVAYPEISGRAPVVIVVHEIFGMTDWVRAVADNLAANGFIALAPDLLSGKGPEGGGTASFKGDEVRAAIRALPAGEVAARLDAVRAYGIARPAATKKSGIIGFCWGGGVSFAYAAHQPKLNAAAVFYGTAPEDAGVIAKIVAPVSGFYGGDDARVTATVEGTKQAMATAKKDYTPHIYAGAGHGFLRQQTGREGANLKAAQEAWPSTIDFFKEKLVGPLAPLGVKSASAQKQKAPAAKQAKTVVASQGAACH